MLSQNKKITYNQIINFGEELMKKEQLEQIKKILIDWRNEIIESQKKAVIDMAKEGEEQIFPDPTDRATYEEDRARVLKIKDRELKLLHKIEDTLRRIDSGEYGICKECGTEIPFERLLARPVTDLCIECKTEQEEKEKE
jgi:DnaK suppressor protein